MPRPLRGVVVLVVLLACVAFAPGARAAPGDLDLTFSGDGKQTTDFGVSAGAGGVALAPYGKIVAVGHAGTGDGGDFALARYNPTGLLDPSFSGDGMQTTNFGGDPSAFGDGANGVAIAPSGRIVVVGWFGADGFALARYNPTGLLDPTFSGDGKQTTLFGNTGGTASAVAIQQNGRIVVAGYSGSSFALARYNLNGTLDTTFSGDGKQTTLFGNTGYNDARGVAIQPNGKIVAVGFRGDGGGANFALARYNPNGTLDTTFSGDGKQTTNFGGYDGAHEVALQPNGKIVVVGFALGGDFGLARYNPNGSLDPTFSDDGKKATNFGGGGDSAGGVAIPGDGKIVASGCACPDNVFARDFALARYNPNGSLDPTFSGDGKQTTDFGAEEGGGQVALQGDGKIVAVGGTGTGGGDFALARYLGG